MKTHFCFQRSFSLIFFIAILLCENVNAKNYYFSSSSGNDSYTSLQAQNPLTPWQTLGKLNSFFNSLKPGDSVLLKRGDVFVGNIYAEPYPSLGGSLGYPIVIGAYGTGANPVITGLTSVSSWINISGNIWESTSPVSSLSNVNMVAVNGVTQPMGRWPKLTASNGGWLLFQSHLGDSSITSNQIAITQSFIGGEVVIRKTHWIIDRGWIKSQTPTTVNYKTIHGGTQYIPQNNWGFFFQNNVNVVHSKVNGHLILLPKSCICIV